VQILGLEYCAQIDESDAPSTTASNDRFVNRNLETMTYTNGINMGFLTIYRESDKKSINLACDTVTSLSISPSPVILLRHQSIGNYTDATATLHQR
jgi:hypothetical protein